MKAYIYRAALHCEECGDRIQALLTEKGKAPANPDDEYTFDSDDFPKGPFSDGGGEADCENYCDTCGCALDNPLTIYGQTHREVRNR